MQTCKHVVGDRNKHHPMAAEASPPPPMAHRHRHRHATAGKGECARAKKKNIAAKRSSRLGFGQPRDSGRLDFGPRPR